MGQKNTPCIHQMLDPHLHICHYCHILQGEVSDNMNQSRHLELSASGNTVDRRIFYGHQYNGLSHAGPSNFHTSSRLLSSFSKNFPAYRSYGSSYHLPPTNYIDEFGINSYAGSIREFGKIKSEEMPPRSFNYSSSFTPLNHGLPHWEPSHLQETYPAIYRNSEYPEYQERGYIQTAVDRSLRNRCSVSSLWPEFAYFIHPNYGLQATNGGQYLDPAITMWLVQFGTKYFINGWVCFDWNDYNRAITYLHEGGLLNPTQCNSHRPLSLVQNMQLPYYGHQLQIQAPYFQHSLNTLNLFGSNPVSLTSGSIFLNFPSNAGHIIRDHGVQHAAPDFSHAGGRIFSLEDAALMNAPVLDRVENVIDQFEGLRLNIEDMSYEEILELEEEIGDVNTGLTEEFIAKNLKTSEHNSQTKSRFSQETEPCSICLEEFKENEIICTLNCGHSYHNHCVREWLLQKNVCPLCKETALVNDNSEG